MSREQQQTAAVVALLKAMPDAQVSAVLDALGVTQETRPSGYQDTRRCQTCGFGWVRHKVLADHPQDGHAWNPKPHTQEENRG